MKFLILSDTHLIANSDERLYGINPYDSLNALLRSIKKRELSFDCIIHLGDISNDGSMESYLQAKKILLENYPSVPVVLTPGNYDEVENLSAAFVLEEIYNWKSQEKVKSICIKDSQLVLITGCFPRKDSPLLEEEFLVKLTQHLESKSRIILLSHYPICSINSHGADTIVSLKNRQDILSTLKKNYQNIECVISGHLHRPFSVFESKINFIGVGSSAYNCNYCYANSDFMLSTPHTPLCGILEIIDSRFIFKHVTS